MPCGGHVDGVEVCGVKMRKENELVDEGGETRAWTGDRGKGGYDPGFLCCEKRGFM